MTNHAMSRIPRIADSEWAVMKVLWDRSPRTAQEVIAALTDSHDWSPKTVKTLLNRLVKKGALDFEVDGKRYRYRPRVRRADCVAAETSSFLSRVFDGSLAPMVAHLVDRESLSPDQIEELRRILDQEER